MDIESSERRLSKHVFMKDKKVKEELGDRVKIGCVTGCKCMPSYSVDKVADSHLKAFLKRPSFLTQVLLISSSS